MVNDAPKLDVRIKTDEALFFAAKADAARLRQDYIDSVDAISKPSRSDDETRQRLARLDRSRAYLSQAMTLMDLARGDGAY